MSNVNASIVHQSIITLLQGGITGVSPTQKPILRMSLMQKIKLSSGDLLPAYCRALLSINPETLAVSLRLNGKPVNDIVSADDSYNAEGLAGLSMVTIEELLMDAVKASIGHATEKALNACRITFYTDVVGSIRDDSFGFNLYTGITMITTRGDEVGVVVKAMSKGECSVDLRFRGKDIEVKANDVDYVALRSFAYGKPLGALLSSTPPHVVKDLRHAAQVIIGAFGHYSFDASTQEIMTQV
jgi:hypothetical protein